MASSRNSKSTGLRILWIPGKRKQNPKGRYDSTNKQVSYNSDQSNKNQMWSLGGSKSHKHFIESEPDTRLLDGPSVSGLSPLAACSVTATAATTAGQVENFHNTDDSTDNKAVLSDACSTPNSSSTALLVSVPNSPEPLLVTATTVAETREESSNMPAAKLTTPSSVTTTVAEIIGGENRFAAFHKNDLDDIDTFDQSTPPKDDPNWRNNLRIHTTSGETTNSIATMSSVSPNSDAKSTSSSPAKKKSQRNHNNNHQNDVNSIESVSEGDPMPELDWIDELMLDHQANEVFRKTSKHKKKKQHASAKDLDQLDGIATKNKLKESDMVKEETITESPEDDKIVKCLYFTLMCCECSIS